MRYFQVLAYICLMLLDYILDFVSYPFSVIKFLFRKFFKQLTRTISVSDNDGVTFHA